MIGPGYGLTARESARIDRPLPFVLTGSDYEETLLTGSTFKGEACVPKEKLADIRRKILDGLMTRVLTAKNPTEAHLFQGILESRGIPSQIRREALFGAMGEVPVFEAMPEIWVEDDQAAEAMAVLQTSTEQAPAGPNGMWRCPHCFEMVEAQFTQCWSCQTVRPVLP